MVVAGASAYAKPTHVSTLRKYGYRTLKWDGTSYLLRILSDTLTILQYQ